MLPKVNINEEGEISNQKSNVNYSVNIVNNLYNNNNIVKNMNFIDRPKDNMIKETKKNINIQSFNINLINIDFNKN